jgi:hypothetical protein
MRRRVGLLWAGLLFVAVGLGGCQKKAISSVGPPSIRQRSQSLSLPERIDLLQRYVTFRRNYLELEFDIFYQNNNSSLPGPSDWDIRLLARVPAAEVDVWVPAQLKAQRMKDPSWLTELPALSGQMPGPDEWYLEPHREIGINRKSGVVAYRSYTQ